MNRLTATMLGILCVATVAASAPSGDAAPAPAKSPPPMSKYQREHLERLKISAPGDQYFGKMKMSFLGINNTLHDAAITSGDHTTDSGIVSKISFAEDALLDWEKRFPRDPQLARSYYLGITAEKKIWVQANQQRAWAYMNRLASVFPTTYFGKLAKKEIARGFTEHYYSEPVPCRTASPSPTPEPTVSVLPAAPAPRGRAVATPRPTPTEVPTPTPSPEPSATPIPEPTQIARGLKLQVLTPPCVPPPSPTPTPTAAPVPPAAPTVSAAASPTPRPR